MMAYIVILNFITDFYKTAVTSLSTISFGFLLSINSITVTDTLIANTSLALGCVVAMLAIVNGICKLRENIRKIKEDRRLQKQLKKQNKKQYNGD